MKQTTIILAAACGAFGALGLTGSALAADAMPGMNMAGMKMQEDAAPAATGDAQGLTDAVVKQVDAASGMVTLQHGAMANLGMPAMTMAYKAGTAALLDQAMPGARVKVRVENIQGALTIVKLMPQ